MLDGATPFRTGWHATAQRLLLERVGGSRPGAGAQPQQEPARADVLQRRGHHREGARIPVGHVEDQRSNGDPRHLGGERRQDRPALQHVRRPFHGAGQMVVQPHAVEPCPLGRQRAARISGQREPKVSKQNVDAHVLNVGRGVAPWA